MTSRRAPYPVVRVFGDPEARGHAYGAAARSQILQSIAGYAKVFRHYAGWDWPTVRAHASRYGRIIDEFSPHSAREMAAIAAGAGVQVEDVLALNTRSEIMFAARGPDVSALLAECTSFAVAPHRAAEGRVVAGQNWDWLEQSGDNVIVLEVRRDDGPDFATLVEAGQLAKVGLNAAGVGLCTNTLISDGDEGRAGVPYQVLLRSVLDSGSGPEAAATVWAAGRANSANYVIVDDTGFMVDLETAPFDGGFRALPEDDGILAHANHFLCDGLTGKDRYLERKPHSLNRLANLRRSLHVSDAATWDGLRIALADHRESPQSVCQHADPSIIAEERTCTLAGVLLDVSGRRMHYTSGSPCTQEWEQISL
jgi:isopenicillin-N N-acyltransferase-like protein